MPYPRLPPPPYYVAIFRSTRNGVDSPALALACEQMLECARMQPGFLGMHSVRDAAGDGITLSYWDDEASIRRWRAEDAYGVVRETGRRDWYERYLVQIARVERAYDWKAAEAPALMARPVAQD